MKDISDLDTRISNIEKYIKLKESEQNVIGNPPKDKFNNNKPILGTLVDEFKDLSIADTTQDFAASIENHAMSCYKDIVEFGLQPVNSQNSLINEKFITLGYTEVPAISVENNTMTYTVNPSMIAKFDGFVTLTPESDYFYSLEHQPAITDSFGRLFELIQAQKANPATFTTTFLQTIGANRYDWQIYLGSLLVGKSQPVTTLPSITMPHFSTVPTVTEPSTTQTKPVTFAGVAPITFLNTTWTGTPINLPTTLAAYAPAWVNNGIVGGAALLNTTK